MGSPIPYTPRGQRMRKIVASVPLSKFWAAVNSSEIRTSSAARPASFNVTNLVILKPARIHSSSGIRFHILQTCTQMYQIGMTSAGRSAPVGRETRGTAGRRGRETLPHSPVGGETPPHQWVTNRYPTSSICCRKFRQLAMLFCFFWWPTCLGGGSPMCGGCVRPTLGDTQTQRSCFCLYI